MHNHLYIFVMLTVMLIAAATVVALSSPIDNGRPLGEQPSGCRMLKSP